MASGWISLHRSIINHWIFKDPKKFHAWCTILMNVNHSRTKVNIKGTILICERGDSLNSLETWAKLFGNNWNKSSVRRFLKLLESDSIIVTKSEHKTTRLSVCKYDTYQGLRNADETEMKQERNADETEMTPNNNDNNKNNDKQDDLEPLDTPIKELNFKKWTYEEFKDSVRESNKEKKVEDKILIEFDNYWSEKNEKGKMKFQTQKTWETKKRLTTWINNLDKWKK